MILDLLTCFTQSGGVLTAYAPTATSQNIPGIYIDRSAPIDDGAGATIDFLVNVQTAFTSGGSATVDFQLLGNVSDPTFASGNVVITSSKPIAVATLVAGYRIALKVPYQSYAEYLAETVPIRYYTLNLQIATAVLTAGGVYSWLTNESVQTNYAGKSGYTV